MTATEEKIDNKAVTGTIEVPLQSLSGESMGQGSCKLCDCPSFIPGASPGQICVNQNSEGGTCNHWDHEHN
jgi:hypothetical protein